MPRLGMTFRLLVCGFSISAANAHAAIPLIADDSAYTVVRKIQPVDCRVVRGFLGSPVDGSVKSWTYHGDVVEYPEHGWDGIDYTFNDNDGLHIRLSDGEGFDAVVLRGSARTRMYADVDGLTEPVGEPLGRFPGLLPTEMFQFDDRVRSSSLSFFGTRDGVIGDASFYRVERREIRNLASMLELGVDGPVALPEPSSRFAPQSEVPALAERYGEGKQQILQLSPTSDSSVEVAAGEALHLFTAPAEADYGLMSVLVDMTVSGVDGPSTFTAAVQDPLDPRLDLTWIEFSMNEPGRVRIALDVPDQVVLAGRRLWVTLRFEDAARLTGSDGGGPSVYLESGTKEETISSALDYRKFLLKTFFSLMSEPRPWGRYRNQPREEFFASNRFTAQCPELFLTIDLCHALGPEDDTVRQYREWVYLRNLESLSEIGPPPAPPDGVPDWAWYPRMAWLEVRRIGEWWLNERLAPSGEVGGGIGDDTDFYQQFADLPYYESGGVAARFLENSIPLADVAVEERLRGGVNRRPTDALHAYEEGINHLALMARWYYGDPIHFERAMASARTMAHLTVQTADGRRHFPNFERMGSADVERPRLPRTEGHASPLMWHTAMQVAEYNRNPAALSILGDWADSWLRFMKPGEWGTEVGVLRGDVIRSREDSPLSGGYGGQASAFLWLYSLTGDARMIEPIMYYFRQGESPYPSNAFAGDLYRLGALAELEEARLDSLVLRSPELAVYTDGTEKGLMTSIIGRPNPSTAGIRTLHDLRRWPDMYTSAHQYTDRIFPTLLQGASSSMLGGYTRRNKFNPTQAVSWEGFGTDFGALVTENRRDRLGVKVYSYAEKPMSGRLRVWALEHGRYRLTVGLDDDGDGRMDRVSREETLELAKADRFALTLLPGEVTVVALEQVERLDSIFKRADLAISARTVSADSLALVGTAHNIGSAQVEDVVAAVVDRTGIEIVRGSFGTLKAPVELTPQRVSFVLALPRPPEPGWRVVLDPDDNVDEIFEGNNGVELDGVVE